VVSKPTIYFLSYAGYLYEFLFRKLRALRTQPPSGMRLSRTLRLSRGTFFWAAEDPGGTGNMNLFRSPNGKTVITGGVPVGGAVLVHFDVAMDGRIWALWNLGSDSAVYYSDDKGDTWTLSQTFTGDGTDDLNMIACHAKNANWIAATAFSDPDAVLWATSDRGGSWSSVSLTLPAQASGAGPVTPDYHLRFAGDTILLIYQGLTRKLISVRANIALSSVTETLIIDDSIADGDALILWFGAAIDPDDPDVVVFVGDDDLSVRYFWRSTDGGLSFTQFAYPVGLEGPSGFLFWEGDLYFAVVTDVNETSFYRIKSVRSSSMTPVRLFVTTDADADPETTSENFAVPA